MQHLYPTLWSLVLLLTPALASESPNDAFREALEQKNLELIQELVLKYEKINVNLQDINGDTALMVAIRSNHVSFVEALLQRDDIDVNKRNKYGATALIIAISRDHVTLAELLLHCDDIQVNLQNQYGYTALMFAIDQSHIGIAELLLQRDDTDLNLQSKSGSTALACIENRYTKLNKPQGDKHCYVSLVKRTQIPSLHKRHALLQRGYLQALYAQQPCNQAMKQYRDILLINKIANELEEQQRTVFYQGCLIGYESKNSHYSIDAKNIERYKKSSHYQPLVDKDLIHLLAGYLRKINIKSVSYEADWVHFITCYLWANNRFAMEQHTAHMSLKEVHFWHNQHSPYTEFLDVVNSTHERALFQVVHQQGGYEAVATQYFADGLKQKNIIQKETQVLTKSERSLTPIIMVGFNTLTHQLAI